MLRYNDHLKSWEYSIPQRGHVTKDNAKDLYNICKVWSVWSNFKVSSKLIDILLNNKTEAIKKLEAIAKEETITATYKQKRALIRIIFGRHYEVKTYLEVMQLFTTIEELYVPKPKEEPSNRVHIMSIAEDEAPKTVPETVSNNPLDLNKRKEDQDQQYFYQEKVKPFLRALAKAVKDQNLAEEKDVFVNDLLGIIQDVA